MVSFAQLIRLKTKQRVCKISLSLCITDTHNTFTHILTQDLGYGLSISYLETVLCCVRLERSSSRTSWYTSITILVTGKFLGYQHSFLLPWLKKLEAVNLLHGFYSFPLAAILNFFRNSWSSSRVIIELF